MNSPIFLTLALIVTSCAYLFVVIRSIRASGKRDFSTPWLLVPLSGAILAGVPLVFSAPVSPAVPVLFRLLELLAHLCNILLIWAIAGKIAPASRLVGALIYAWNPLVLIELAVYANTAGVVISVLLLTLWFSGIGPAFRRGGGEVDEGRGRLRRRLYGIAALVLVGVALRINFLTLLMAPLLLWFMARHGREVSAALMEFAWRAVAAVVVLTVAYLPGWQGSASFLAMTNALHLLDFANSPLSLVVMPVRGFFSFVAQRGHFPPSLMQPTTAADMMVLATSFFLFALLYLREMGKVRRKLVGASVQGGTRAAQGWTRAAQGWTRAAQRGTRAAQAPPPIIPTTPAPTPVFSHETSRGGSGGEGWWGRLRRPRPGAILLGADDLHGEIAQRDADMGTENVTTEESHGDEDKHKASTSTFPRPLSLQDEGDEGDGGGEAVDALFTGWTVVILGYIVLVATVFSPGYLVWGVWVVALRRFDTLSMCVLLLSCSALLYYPLQQFASTLTGVLLPVYIFGIPLVYLTVRRWMPAGRMERKNVLT